MSKVFKVGDIVVESGKKEKGLLEVSCRSDGISPIGIPIFVINGKSEGPVLCIDAGVHGDELEPMEAVQRVANDLDPSLLKGVFIGVPVLNVLAYEAGTRSIPSFYEREQNDMNRQAPGNERGFLTQRILYKYLHEVSSKAEYHISFHGGSQAIMHISYAIYSEGPDIRKDIARKNRELAEAFGLDYIQGDIFDPKKMGTIDSHLDKMGHPCIAVEVGMGHDRYLHREEYVDTLYRGIMNVMKYLGMIEGELELPESCLLLSRKDEGYGFLHCNQGGLWIPKKKAADRVSRGELVGTIVNIFGEEVERIVAPAEGLIIQMRGHPVTSGGAWILNIGKVEGEITPLKKG